MRTGAQLKALGVETWYHAHARRYEAMFERAGWNDKQIDRAIQFGATYQGDGSEADIIQQFRESSEYVSSPELDLVIDAGLGLRDTITTRGIEALPPLESEAFTDAHAARLAEIRQIARDDPQGFESNRALQAQQLALLEAQVAAAKGGTQ